MAVRTVKDPHASFCGTLQAVVGPRRSMTGTFLGLTIRVPWFGFARPTYPSTPDCAFVMYLSLAHCNQASYAT